MRPERVDFVECDMGNDHPGQDGIFEFKPRSTGEQKIVKIERY